MSLRWDLGAGNSSEGGTRLNVASAALSAIIARPSAPFISFNSCYEIGIRSRIDCGISQCCVKIKRVEYEARAAACGAKDI